MLGLLVFKALITRYGSSPSDRMGKQHPYYYAMSNRERTWQPTSMDQLQDMIQNEENFFDWGEEEAEH